MSRKFAVQKVQVIYPDESRENLPHRQIAKSKTKK